MRLPAPLQGVWRLISAVIDWAKGRWHAAQHRWPGVRRAVAAWDRMNVNHGSQYAAAITYFSFLAIFPLLLLAVSVIGFVLHAHPSAQQRLLDAIADNIPGDFGTTLADSVRTFIGNRTSVGLIGLGGLLLTGLGWIGNLRAAIEVMWGRLRVERNWFVGRAANLLVLVGLGLGVLISIGLTVAGSAVTDQIISGLGWSNGRTALTIAGIAAALVGDFVIFIWMLVRLPGVKVPRAVAVKGAVFASVGLEVLKLVGTYTISRTARSLTAGPFASVIAILVWLQLVARLMLLTAAWMAVSAQEVTLAEEKTETAGMDT